MGLVRGETYGMEPLEMPACDCSACRGNTDDLPQLDVTTVQSIDGLVLAEEHPWRILAKIKTLEARIADLEAENKDPHTARLLMRRVFGQDKDW